MATLRSTAISLLYLAGITQVTRTIPGHKAATRPALSDSCRYRQVPIRLR
jgi:hypothetical protein